MAKSTAPVLTGEESALRGYHLGDLLVVAYGLGVDSTAALVGMHQRGIRPDMILFADTGGEKRETYAYLPVIQAWLARVDFPAALALLESAPFVARYAVVLVLVLAFLAICSAMRRARAWSLREMSRQLDLEVIR